MYLDPGFGGMMVQLIIALVAAGGALIYTFRRKIAEFFKKNKGQNVSKDTISQNENLNDEIVDTIQDDGSDKQN